MSFALRFTAKRSRDSLWNVLNQTGPWTWRGSDSDNYGTLLWCLTDNDVHITIYGEGPRWIIEVSIDLNDTEGRQAIERVLTERIFPAISARDIVPTDTVR